MIAQAGRIRAFIHEWGLSLGWHTQLILLFFPGILFHLLREQSSLMSHPGVSLRLFACNEKVLGYPQGWPLRFCCLALLSLLWSHLWKYYRWWLLPFYFLTTFCLLYVNLAEITHLLVVSNLFSFLFCASICDEGEINSPWELKFHWRNLFSKVINGT